MRLKQQWWSGLVAAVLSGLVDVTAMAAAVPMNSTPLVYALTAQATQAQIPLLTAGIGRADAADGRVFPYVYPPRQLLEYEHGQIRFLGQQADGMDRLKGQKIAHIYQDDAYGQETIPLLDTQAAHYGFAVQHLAVPWPGLEQKATWLRVKVAQPDWIILRAGGVMTWTALKEAARSTSPTTRSWGRHRPARSRTWCRPERRPLTSSV